MVRKVRFELTRPFGHQGLGLTRLPFRHMRTLVGREGLGPSVFLMSRVYSPLVSPLTTPTHMVAGWDSNPHMSAYEAGVLPVDYPALLPCSGLVLEKGFGPLTCGLSIRCSAN